MNYANMLTPENKQLLKTAMRAMFDRDYEIDADILEYSAAEFIKNKFAITKDNTIILLIQNNSYTAFPFETAWYEIDKYNIEKWGTQKYSHQGLCSSASMRSNYQLNPMDIEYIIKLKIPDHHKKHMEKI